MKRRPPPPPDPAELDAAWRNWVDVRTRWVALTCDDPDRDEVHREFYAAIYRLHDAGGSITTPPTRTSERPKR